MDKELNIRPQAIKILKKKKTQEIPCRIGLGKESMTKSPKALATKSKIEKWD